jgi:hypothetical protein
VLEVVESQHAAIALYRRSGWGEVGRTSLSLPDGRDLSELVFAASASIPPAVEDATAADALPRPTLPSRP